MSDKVLLGDLSSGQYVKLALADPGQRPQAVNLYGCTSAEDFQQAILSFVADNGNPKVADVAFSTSGWEVDGQIDLVHFGFTLNRHHIQDRLATRSVRLINDFVAKALAVPALGDDERVHVCGPNVRPEQVVAVIGPTTGLGAAFLAPDGRRGWVATHCEGGHADLAASTDLEIDIFKMMLARFGHVSWERAVAAPGLPELWRCLAVIDGEDGETPPAVEEILALAWARDPRARLAVQVQTELFAAMTSNAALTMGARGGVYLCGSHLDDLGDLFDHEVFARRFYEKGRVSSYVRDIPVFKIVAAEPEILGLSTLFD
jgi:glucokinase